MLMVLSTKVNSKMINVLVREFSIPKMALNIQDNLLTI